MNITEVTRRQIIDYLIMRPYWGKLDILEFLELTWDLTVNSEINRKTTAYAEIHRHYVTFSD
jgi:hypothetical protein